MHMLADTKAIKSLGHSRLSQADIHLSFFYVHEHRKFLLCQEPVKLDLKSSLRSTQRGVQVAMTPFERTCRET